MKRLKIKILMFGLTLGLLTACGNKAPQNNKINTFKNGEPNTVLEEPETISPEEQKRLDTLAEAEALYTTADYTGVINTMLDLEDYSEYPVFTNSVKYLANDMVNALCQGEDYSDKMDFLAGLPVDEATASAICQPIMTRCQTGSYQAFLAADQLIAAAGEQGENVKELASYLSENGKARAIAFMNADWERTDSKCPLYLFVATMTYNDSTKSAVLTYINQSINSYHFKTGDLKFKDIKLIDDRYFSCQNMGRYQSGGSIFYDYAEAWLDYDNNAISMDVNIRSNNVSGSAQHWRRISTEPPMSLEEVLAGQMEEVVVEEAPDRRLNKAKE